MKLYFREILPHLGEMLEGLKYSLILTVISMGLGLVIGILACVMKNGKNKTLRVIANAYIEIIRNTPLLVQLYILYFGLAEFGIDLSPFQASAIAMTINAGAYNAEIFRGGLLSVPNGLSEAGHALGMTSFQVFTRVKLKIAMRNAFPGLINQLVLLFLFSSVTATISMHELSYVTFNLQSSTARVFEVLIISGILYYACSAIWVFVFRRLQKKIFAWK